MKNLLLATILLFGPMISKMNASASLSFTKPAGSFSLFQGHRQGSGVGLLWSYNSSNVISFEIENSYDGEYFNTVAAVQPTASSHYRFLDNNVWPGYIYYRIKAMHEDGSFEYSQTIVVRIVSRK